MENFKHYIGINQRAIVELGLDLDFTDVAVFEYIKSFANSPKCVKVNTDDGIFFWVSHKNIMDEMPMLRIKTSQGIINRVEKLIDAGLLAKYKDCEKFGKTLYTFGPNYDLYEGFDTPKENLRGPSTKVEGNSISLNNTSNNPTLFDNKDSVISPKIGNGKSIDERKAEFHESLRPYLQEYGEDMIIDFFNYWVEENQSGTKMRFEMERVFELKRRLITWKRKEEERKFRNKR